MEISEVRVKMTGGDSDRVRAFCSVTFDGEFVVRDIKVIEGTSGLFVAMPSRKIADHCPKCRGKNHLRARYCNECGAKLREGRAPRNDTGRSKLHADIAHPINMNCRERLQEAILEAFEAAEKEEGPREDRRDDRDRRTERPDPDDRDRRDDKADQDDYDNGADYAALIAELRSGGRDRSEDRQPETPQDQVEPAVPAEPEPPASPEPEAAEPEPAEAPETVEATEPEEPKTRSGFGEGIL